MLGLRSRMWSSIGEILGIGLQVIRGSLVRWTVVWKTNTSRMFFVQVKAGTYQLGLDLVNATAGINITTSDIADLGYLAIPEGPYDVTYSIEYPVGTVFASKKNVGELVIVAPAVTAEVISGAITIA